MQYNGAITLFLNLKKELSAFMKYTKEEARRKVLNCAKQYANKLLNKKLIIIIKQVSRRLHMMAEFIFTELERMKTAAG